MERASPRSRLKRAWWKEAEEFEIEACMVERSRGVSVLGGMSWGCRDNGLKERQRRQLRRGERERKNFDFLFGYLDLYQKQWVG